MALIWSVVGSNTAITTTADLMTIVPAAGRPCRLYRVDVSQKNLSQDAHDAQQRIQLVTGNTTAGSGGAGATPHMLTSPTSAATPGATCTAFNTTIATGGAAVVLYETCFDVRAGWLWIPTPDERIDIPVTTNRLCVRLADAPSASTTFSITVHFEEMG